MATDRNRKRLENIEKALTPRELLAYCIEESTKFASRVEYAAWLAEDLSRWPISRILRQIAIASANGSPGLSKQKKEVMFLIHLLLTLDKQVRHILAPSESSLDAITFCLAAAHQSVLFSLKMCELSESLAVAARAPDDDLADAAAFAAETREEFCRRGSTFGGPEIGTSMKFVRANLCPLLIKVRATIAAIESLNARYFPGLKIMFKSDADALDTLERRATGLVRDYHNVMDLLGQIPFHPEVLDGTEKLDQERIDQAVQKEAANLAHQLVTLAHADTLFESDGEKALDLVRPLLRAEIQAYA
jgi:hypothetical protein